MSANNTKDVAALEKSLPSLVTKLKKLSETLSAPEQAVFKEIIESAAKHTELVKAHDQGSSAISGEKPMSVHSTASMKDAFLKLPETLGLK